MFTVDDGGGGWGKDCDMRKLILLWLNFGH